MGMLLLLVFSPNWFPIFICFVKLATEHRLSNRRTQTHMHTHTQAFSSLRIYGHLQSGCGFCKQNLLRPPPSVSGMHQRPCLSEEHIHTRAFIHTGMDRMQYGQQGRRRRLLYILPVAVKIPPRPSLLLLELEEAP